MNDCAFETGINWPESNFLYFTPSLSTIINLRDPSFSIAPEIAYKGITNLELAQNHLSAWKEGDRIRGKAERLPPGIPGEVLFLRGIGPTFLDWVTGAPRHIIPLPFGRHSGRVNGCFPGS